MINWKLALSLFIEFGPLGAFFLGNEIKGFLFGATLLVLSVPLSLILGYVKDRRFAAFPFAVGMFVLLLGGATVVTHNPMWLKLEFTLYNSIFGFALLCSVALGKPLMQRLFDDIFQITERGWYTLSLRWGTYLMFVGITNEMVRLLYPTDIWVDYRAVFAVIGILFTLAQMPLAKRERLPHASPWGLRK